MYHGSDTYTATKRAHPSIHWRHHIVQTKKATGFDELTFDPKVTKPLIDGGKDDAKKAIQAMRHKSLFLQ